MTLVISTSSNNSILTCHKFIALLKLKSRLRAEKSRLSSPQFLFINIGHWRHFSHKTIVFNLYRTAPRCNSKVTCQLSEMKRSVADKFNVLARGYDCKSQ